MSYTSKCLKWKIWKEDNWINAYQLGSRRTFLLSWVRQHALGSICLCLNDFFFRLFVSLNVPRQFVFNLQKMTSAIEELRRSHRHTQALLNATISCVSHHQANVHLLWAMDIWEVRDFIPNHLYTDRQKRQHQIMVITSHTTTTTSKHRGYISIYINSL